MYNLKKECQAKAVLSYKYLVPVSLLDEYTIDLLKKELRIRPIKYTDPSKKVNTIKNKSDEPNFEIYWSISPDSKYFEVPRSYGLLKFGLPSNSLLTAGTPRRLPTFVIKLDEINRKQETAITKIVQALKTDKGACFRAPVGSGKTNIGLCIAFLMNTQALWITHTIGLLEQSKARAESVMPGIRCGVIQATNIDIIDKDIIIATVQTLHNLLCNTGKSKKSQRPETIALVTLLKKKIATEIGLVILDEVHHYAAKTFSEVLTNIRPKYVVGLSATLARTDGLIKAVNWYIGPTVTVNITRKQHVEAFIYMYNKEYSWLTAKSSYNTVLDAIAQNKERSGLLTDLLMSVWFEPFAGLTELPINRVMPTEPRQILVLSKTTDHIRALRQDFIEKCFKRYTLAIKYLKKVIFGPLFKRYTDDSKRYTDDRTEYASKETINYLKKKILGFCVPTKDLPDIMGYLTSESDKKKENIKARTKPLQIIFSTYKMAAEGMDIARLNTIFLMTPAENPEQCIGRILREAYEYDRNLSLDEIKLIEKEQEEYYKYEIKRIEEEQNPFSSIMGIKTAVTDNKTQKRRPVKYISSKKPAHIYDVCDVINSEVSLLKGGIRKRENLYENQEYAIKYKSFKSINRALALF